MDKGTFIIVLFALFVLLGCSPKDDTLNSRQFKMCMDGICSYVQVFETITCTTTLNSRNGDILSSFCLSNE